LRGASFATWQSHEIATAACGVLATTPLVSILVKKERHDGAGELGRPVAVVGDEVIVTPTAF
jgi:hypothetical protein